MSSKRFNLKATIDMELAEMERQNQELESYGRYCYNYRPGICDYGDCLVCQEEMMDYDYDDYRDEIAESLESQRKAIPSVILLFATITEDEPYSCITQTRLIGAFATKEEVERATERARKYFHFTDPYTSKTECYITFTEKEVSIGDLSVDTEAIIASAFYVE